MTDGGNGEAAKDGRPTRPRPYPHARQAHARPEPIGHVDRFGHVGHLDHEKIDYETYERDERDETTDRGGG